MRLFGFEAFFRNFLNVPKESSFQFFLIFCNRPNIKSCKGSLFFRIFGFMRLPLKFLIFCFFSKLFLKDSKSSLSFFLKFCNRMLVKKFQRAPFTVFGIMRNFKMNNFCLESRFSEAQHAISEFFSRPAFFLCYFFSNLFHRSPPPQFLLEMKRFASIKDCSRFSALCDLPETIKNIFENFFLNFLFLKGISLRKMVFLLFSVGEE